MTLSEEQVVLLRERQAEQMAALKETMFRYLDDVQASGLVNMFGAAPYVQEEFGLSKQEAKDVLESWMLTYTERHPHGK